MKTKNRVRVFLLLIACLLMLALCSCTVGIEPAGECLDVVSLMVWSLVLLVSIVVVAGMIKMELRE